MKLSAFGLCSRKLRLELGLTLRDMAVALGVSSPYLSSIELGERTLTKKIADQAMTYFHNKNISKDQMLALQSACDQSMNAVPVSMLQANEKNLVAAFARRLSEGQGVPDDVWKWIHGRERDDS